MDKIIQLYQTDEETYEFLKLISSSESEIINFLQSTSKDLMFYKMIRSAVVFGLKNIKIRGITHNLDKWVKVTIRKRNHGYIAILFVRESFEVIKLVGADKREATQKAIIEAGRNRFKIYMFSGADSELLKPTGIPERISIQRIKLCSICGNKHTRRKINFCKECGRHITQLSRLRGKDNAKSDLRDKKREIEMYISCLEKSSKTSYALIRDYKQNVNSIR